MRSRSGRFPLAAAALLAGAGLALLAAVAGVALAVDPEEDETSVAALMAVTFALLFALLLWAGVFLARRRSGWSRTSTAVLAGSVVLATAIVTLVVLT